MKQTLAWQDPILYKYFHPHFSFSSALEFKLSYWLTMVTWLEADNKNAPTSARSKFTLNISLQARVLLKSSTSSSFKITDSIEYLGHQVWVGWIGFTSERSWRSRDRFHRRVWGWQSSAPCSSSWCSGGRPASGGFGRSCPASSDFRTRAGN